MTIGMEWIDFHALGLILLRKMTADSECSKLNVFA
jgi:hypothetical protein